MFDQRLAAKVIKVVDVSYGGENGFNQVCAHVLSDSDILKNRTGY
jgi:peptide chain release factor subunit 1